MNIIKDERILRAEYKAGSSRYWRKKKEDHLNKYIAK